MLLLNHKLKWPATVVLCCVANWRLLNFLWQSTRGNMESPCLLTLRRRNRTIGNGLRKKGLDRNFIDQWNFDSHYCNRGSYCELFKRTNRGRVNFKDSIRELVRCYRVKLSHCIGRELFHIRLCVSERFNSLFICPIGDVQHHIPGEIIQLL